MEDVCYDSRHKDHTRTSWALMKTRRCRADRWLVAFAIGEKLERERAGGYLTIITDLQSTSQRTR